VNPPCNRKSRNGNPPPTAGRALLLSQRCPLGGLCAELHKEGGDLGKRSAKLYSEPIGWIEEQFRAAGHEKDSRELAVHLFCVFQGMAAVAHSANDPDVIVTEVKRLKDWIRTTL